MDRNDKPPIAAAFLVVFDQKVGYTIAWKRSLPDVDVDGVEYKSLPSGLHAVKEDLVYFVEDVYAGVSVFVQEEADAKHRNASFVAVGALVPLSQGQLGRSWLHAEELRILAKEVVKNPADNRPLELFWTKHRADKQVERGPASPIARHDGSGLDTRKRKRAMSEATIAGFHGEAAWPQDHPALYVPTLLDTFGPLLFPLHRAALLRKRILFLGTPPVQRQANVVYVTSVLSNISRSLGENLPVEAEPLLHSHPYFSVGVTDLPALADQDVEGGWLACSTDDILGEKKQVYDLLVVLPSFQSGPHKHWPMLKTPDGTSIKATQRDLRRWKLLRRELRRLKRQSDDESTHEPSSDQPDDDDEQPLLSHESSVDNNDNIDFRHRDASEIVEPSSWSALAYRGFLWWASAGEAQAWESDEVKVDEELLFDMPDVLGFFSNPADHSEINGEERQLRFSRAAATLLVAYFRRVTEQLLRSAASIVEEADDNTEEGIEENEIKIGTEQVREMGLDTWSQMDKAFVQEMVKVWFHRTAVVVGGGIHICGLRVC